MPPSVFIENRLYKILLSQARTAGIGNLIIGTLVYLSLVYMDVDSGYIILWFLALIFVAIVRMSMSQLYRLFSSEKTRTISCLRIYTLLSIALSLIWSLLPLMSLEGEGSLIHYLTFVVILGVISTSVATLSAWLPAFIGFVIPPMLALIWMLLHMQQQGNLLVTLACVIYLLVIIRLGKVVNYNQREMLELEVNNKALIDELHQEVGQRKEAHVQLEFHERQLEALVAKRSEALTKTNMELEQEIGERIKTERSLHHLANYDPLTELPNRHLLIDRIRMAIANATREGSMVAVLFFDLDRFKNINDTLGHAIGDQLLFKVATRLRHFLRDRDTLARNGGDEFVVLLTHIQDREGLGKLAIKLINLLTQPYIIDSHQIHVGASIGISTFPDDGEQPDILLRNADTAMYQAKQGGGDGFVYYDNSMLQQMRERLEMEGELRQALDNNEFFLVYQPQVDYRNGDDVVGLETLLRWNNPRLGLVSPVCFIPILEDSGLIFPVGEWIIEHVIRFISEGRAGDATVSVNLSAMQCRSKGLLQFIRTTIAEYQINPKSLEFEVTESLFVDNFNETIEFLDQLHSTGCSIALDDFGTGYTSMNYLIRLPIDTIKVDRSFITDIDSKENLQSIVRAIVSMSCSLGLDNVFEGVETEAEREAISQLRDPVVIQGYFYSKPLTESELEIWLESR